MPKRRIELVADAAYASGEFVKLPVRVSFVSRLRRNAALYRLAPPRTGLPGRPATKGKRLGSLEQIAADKRRRWRDVTVTRYGRTEQVQALTLVCLWYSVTKSKPVRVVLIRESGSSKAFDFALIATDSNLGVEHVIERYAERWAIEVARPKPRHDLVRAQRPHPCSRRCATPASTLVPPKDRAVLPRHAHHAPTPHHPRPISGNTAYQRRSQTIPRPRTGAGIHGLMNGESRGINRSCRSIGDLAPLTDG